MLVGGGHSHVIFLRMLLMNPVPGLAVTLISPETSTPYSGMLPGLVAGHYQAEDVYIDLGPLCRRAGADFIRGEVLSMETDKKRVHVVGRPPIRYDVLSIDIGSTPYLPEAISADAVIPVKPISSFLTRWRQFEDRCVELLHADRAAEIGVVGAGAGGVELCLAIYHYLVNQHPTGRFRLHLFTDKKTVLAEYPANVRIRFEKALAAQSILVHREFHAEQTLDGELIANDGRVVTLDETFWVTRAGAQSWPAAAGLATDDRGFIQTGDTLQCLNHLDVFAVGDCAAMINHPRPKAGVYAVRQGKPLFENIKAWVTGKPVSAFTPQSGFLSLITTGPKRAVASWRGLALEGQWVWRWKHAIDQRFMTRFRDLPVMTTTPPNTLVAEFGDQMHCGGCGSKVSADLLREVLTELMGDALPADDAARVDVPAGQTLLQSVDHFRSFVNDPYLQARIAVVHACSDIYACGGRPVSAMTMLTLPFGKPAVTRGLLHQVMRGILDQLAAEGADLIGGHTSEGLELSIGCTINGGVAPDQQWPKQGGDVGDLLILTKPLGTGTIFAADMQSKASGSWVAGALAVMSQSNRPAAEVLSAFGVRACTDVTGFGLAGHCLEMLGAHNGIELNLASLPLLDGAQTCLQELRIVSSLHEANKQSLPQVIDDPAAEILFDPQTSGGLLAVIPAQESVQCLQQLHAAGVTQAAIIGTVTEQSGLSLG